MTQAKRGKSNYKKKEGNKHEANQRLTTQREALRFCFSGLLVCHFFLFSYPPQFPVRPPSIFLVANASTCAMQPLSQAAAHIHVPTGQEGELIGSGPFCRVTGTELSLSRTTDKEKAR